MKPIRQSFASFLAATIAGSTLPAQVATDGDVPTTIDGGGTADNPASYVIGESADYQYTQAVTLGSSTSFNSLTIQNGADLIPNTGILMGSSASDSNSLTVEGDGSTVGGPYGDSDDLVILTASSDNTITVQNGGAIRLGSIYATAPGTSFTVTGAGSEVDASVNLRIDYSGTQFTASNGATVNADDVLYLGRNSGGATFTATGTGTTVTSDRVLVGSTGGTGNTLQVLDGASMNVGTELSFQSSDQSNLLVDGDGSILTATSIVTLRSGSPDYANTLTLSNGGMLVNASGFNSWLGSNDILQFQDGYFAWIGDKTSRLESFITGSQVQVSDGAGGWVTATLDDMTIQYFDGDSAAAEAFSGFAGLGAYTIITGNLSAVPEPSTYAAGAGLAALLLAASRRRRTQAAVQ